MDHPYNTIYYNMVLYTGGLVQDFSISSALAMEILQSCIEPTIYDTTQWQMSDTDQTINS